MGAADLDYSFGTWHCILFFHTQAREARTYGPVPYSSDISGHFCSTNRRSY